MKFLKSIWKDLRHFVSTGEVRVYGAQRGRVYRPLLETKNTPAAHGPANVKLKPKIVSLAAVKRVHGGIDYYSEHGPITEAEYLRLGGQPVA